MNDIFPIADFVRNASEHTARIRLTKRAEILTQYGRPSLAVMAAEESEEYERLTAATDFMDGIEAVKAGLEAAEAGHSKPAADVIRAWEAL